MWAAKGAQSAARFCGPVREKGSFLNKFNQNGIMQQKHILADLHTHLNEKNIDPKKWWEAVLEKKLNVIAITEHVERNPQEAYEKLFEIKPKNVMLIPGMECKTSAGHLLVFGANKSIYDICELQKVNVDIEKALALVNENNLAASFAHPYGYKNDSTTNQLGEKESKRLMKKYGIGSEYYNGMLGSANGFIFGTQWVKKLYNFFDFMSKSKKANKFGIQKKSKKIKSKLEIISLETFERVRKGILFGQDAKYITVGSDAHYPRVIGTAVLELKKMPKDETTFLKMLKNKEILWAGPNVYSKDPVDKLKKKELLEGLKYITKNRIKKGIKKKKVSKSVKKKVKSIKQKIKNKKMLIRVRKKK